MARNKHQKRHNVTTKHGFVTSTKRSAEELREVQHLARRAGKIPAGGRKGTRSESRRRALKEWA
jgi:hypothetical protein